MSFIQNLDIDFIYWSNSRFEFSISIFFNFSMQQCATARAGGCAHMWVCEKFFDFYFAMQHRYTARVCVCMNVCVGFDFLFLTATVCDSSGGCVCTCVCVWEILKFFISICNTVLQHVCVCVWMGVCVCEMFCWNFFFITQQHMCVCVCFFW